MKTILIVFTLAFASMKECKSQKNDIKVGENGKNIYEFSDSIRLEIDKAITKMDSIDGKNNINYFLLMSSLDNETLFTINYCSGCPFVKLVQSSNRVMLAKAGRLEIPIIFSYDLNYSGLLKDESGNWMALQIGGYGFKVGREQRITWRGFHQ